MDEAKRLQVRLLRGCFGRASYPPPGIFIPFLPSSDPSPHDGKGRIRSPADRARAFYKGAAGGGGQGAGGVGGSGLGRTESAMRKAEELSALCTWMNNREFPAWVRNSSSP